MTIRSPFWRYFGGKWRLAPSYPKPLHRQLAYAQYAEGVSCPHADAAAQGVLCLPMSADLREADQDRVVAALRMALAT